MNKHVFHQLVAAPVTRPSRSHPAIPVTLLTTNEPPTTTVRNITQFPDIDLDEPAKLGKLVTTHWLPQTPNQYGDKNRVNVKHKKAFPT